MLLFKITTADHSKIILNCTLLSFNNLPGGLKCRKFSGYMKITVYFFLLLFLISCNNKKTGTIVEVIPEFVSPENFFSFRKADSVNPVLQVDDSRFNCPVQGKNIFWENKNVLNPAAVVRNDTLFLLYRAQEKQNGTSRIGIAWSRDGLHFTGSDKPVLYPDNDVYKNLEWPGGCEDPRVVRDENGNYYMTYTAYDGKTARLMGATSPDLYHWIKQGPVFAKAESGKYADKWTKSGSVIAHYDFGMPAAIRINGKYWMYGGDVNIWLANSDDLINWNPVLKDKGEKQSIPMRRNAAELADFRFVFGPREHKFDSDLVEPGPPAIYNDSVIWLIYNSRNIRSIGDTSLPEGAYTPGYVVLDKNDPAKVLERSENYFMKPDKPYEISGQVNNVCFLEGLVKYHGRWFLYYGTADSKIAVAVK
jgi:predicted GH43/DUF377 family glycosyl hydrolase